MNLHQLLVWDKVLAEGCGDLWFRAGDRTAVGVVRAGYLISKPRNGPWPRVRELALGSLYMRPSARY